MPSSQSGFDFLSQILRVCPTCKQELHDSQTEMKKSVGNLRLVVLGWKVMNGIDRDDKTWDRVHFAANIPHAKKLLKLFNDDVDAVLDCIEDRWKQIVETQGLNLSLAGVVKNSDVFRQRWLEKKEKGVR